MTNNLTLIESDVLEELLEKAFAWEVHQEYGNELMWDAKNKKIMQKKEDFFSKYIDVPVALDESIVEGLERIGYK